MAKETGQNTTTDGTTMPLLGERLTPPTPEPLSERILSYLPPKQYLDMKPAVADLENREKFKTSRPGDEFALVYYPPEQRFVIVPSDFPLNELPGSSNMSVYGSGSMETLTVEPVVGEDGTIREANIVLLGDRMNRLYERSLPSREVNLPVDRDVLAQGITDLIAVLGTNVLFGENGPEIASIRVTVGPGMGKFGKRAVGQELYAGVESYRTKKDFGEEARNGAGLTVAAGPDQRTVPFRGKLASMYGDAARIAEAAKRVGGADAIEFAEYMAHDPSQTIVLDRITEPQQLEQAMLSLALANGLGAELMAVRQEEDGTQTLVLPPMDVKRLGGVTADYIMDHMAPKMGIKTEIAPFCLQDVLDGTIVGLFFAGNAARVAEISTVILHTGNGEVMREIHIPVPEMAQRITEQFEAEVSGATSPSDPSLPTRVDLVEGRKARAVLEQAWANWLQPKPQENLPMPQRRGLKRFFRR